MTTSNRAETVTALVALLGAAASPIPVDDGSPRELSREHIFVGQITTTNLGLNTMGTATRTNRLDVFTIHVHIWAGAPGQSAAAARQRAQALYAYLDDLLATNPKLGGVAGLVNAVVRNHDGPDAEPSDDEGYVGVSTAFVECTSNYV
jgi:hypothetical protein